METNFQGIFPFFEPGLIQKLTDSGVEKRLRAGEQLIREGQYISYFPIVISGLIKVIRRNEDGNEILLYYLKDGEICSMSITCCIGQTRSNIRAVAEKSTTVLLLETGLLDKWMSEFPSWKQYVMRALHSRFNEMLEVVDSIAFLKMDQRLVKFFTDRYEKAGLKTFDGSHQELAYQLNTSREVVSRLLKKLENEGKIKLSRNNIDFSLLL
jgi:CRP/FNR family transcriptional regulator